MTNLKNKLNPLTWNVAIVDRLGMPTQEFMRKWAQQIQTNKSIIDLTKAAGVSDVLDLIGSATGDLLYRTAADWEALAPGATNTLLSIAAGLPAWATLSTLLDNVFSSAQGSILYRGASAWAALAPGTSGYLLSTQGAGANPVWTPSTGGFVPDVEVTVATTAAADTSSYTYSNGVSGVGATLTGPTNNVAVTIDGVTLTALGQAVLVKDDTQSPSGAFNGVYRLTVLQTVGVKPVLTRDTAYDTPTEINETGLIAVISGTANQKTTWLQTATVVTVGTTPLVYAQYSKNPATVVTSAASLAQHSVVIGADGAEGVSTITNGTTGQFLAAVTSNDPAYRALLLTDFPALASAKIWVGNVSNAATAVSPGGDVTMDNAGAFTIKTSVALAGSPTTTTQASSDNSTKIATTAYVQAVVTTSYATVGSTFHPGYVTGRFYGPPGVAGNTNLTMSTGTLYAVPFYVGVTTTFTKIGAWVTTPINGSNLEFGIYQDTNGYPGALVLDAGQVAMTASSAYYSCTINRQLNPGWYWLTISPSSGTTTAVNGVSSANSLFTWAAGNTTGQLTVAQGQLSVAWTYSTGNLPNPFTGGGTYGSGSSPWITMSP
jgi:hypothetical protein